MSKIPWCDATINVMHGCDKVSDGCRNCYAEKFARRLAGMGIRGYRKDEPFEPTRHAWNLEKLWKVPGSGKRIFINSMGDLFHSKISLDYIAGVMGEIEATPLHTFIVCTKRPERMRKFFAEDCKAPSNLIGLVSVEDQQTADKRIPILRQTQLLIRGVSFEPLLEQIDSCLSPGIEVSGDEGAAMGIHWVIVGPETGPGKRPFDPAWAESLWCQCRDAGVSYFWKGEMAGLPWQVREFPNTKKGV